MHRSSASFTLTGPDGVPGPLTLGVPGLHNARNAALAVVSALQVGVPFDVAAAAMARFTGVTRRFEFRGEANGVTFVDDYAHLPFAIEAALATARSGGWSRIVAVFQPHRYTRTAELATEFGTAFADADALVVTDVYGAGEAPGPRRLGTPDRRRRAGPGSAAPRRLRPRMGRAAPGRRLDAAPRRSLPDPGRRRPDDAARRAVGIARSGEAQAVDDCDDADRYDALAVALGDRASAPRTPRAH